MESYKSSISNSEPKSAKQESNPDTALLVVVVPERMLDISVTLVNTLKEPETELREVNREEESKYDNGEKSSDWTDGETAWTDGVALALEVLVGTCEGKGEAPDDLDGLGETGRPTDASDDLDELGEAGRLTDALSEGNVEDIADSETNRLGELDVTTFDGLASGDGDGDTIEARGETVGDGELPRGPLDCNLKSSIPQLSWEIGSNPELESKLLEKRITKSSGVVYENLNSIEYVKYWL